MSKTKLFVFTVWFRKEYYLHFKNARIAERSYMFMKILQVVRQFHPSIGGMEEVVLNLSRHISAMDHDVEVLTLNKVFATNTKLPDYEVIDNIKISRVHFVGSRRFFRVSKLKEKIGAFDLVHVHGIDGLMERVSMDVKNLNIPSIVSSHGGIFHTKFLFPIKKLYFSYTTRQYLSSFSQVVAVSKSDYHMFSQITPISKLTLIENGVQSNKFGSSSFNVGSSDIVYIGRFTRHKQIFNLLDSFQMLLERKKNSKLYIIGNNADITGSDIQEYAEKLNLNDSVKVISGANNEVIKNIVSTCRLVVSASSYEGLGISTLECMGAGLIPVLNDIPAFRSFIQDGENGFLTDFSDAQKSSDTLLNALILDDSLARTISMKANSTAQDFGWDEVARAHIALYESLRKIF